MTNDKLNNLTVSLLSMAEVENMPEKYNRTIIELLNAEGVSNVLIYNHLGHPLVIFNNNEGGISVIAAKVKEPIEDKE